MSDGSTWMEFEECADQMNDFVASLDRCPASVLALVLRAHLSGLLQALMTHDDWTAAQAATFLEELMRETLQAELE